MAQTTPPLLAPTNPTAETGPWEAFINGHGYGQPFDVLDDIWGDDEAHAAKLELRARLLAMGFNPETTPQSEVDRRIGFLTGATRSATRDLKRRVTEGYQEAGVAYARTGLERQETDLAACQEFVYLGNEL